MKRLLLLLFAASTLTTVIGVAGAPPASACSCIDIDALTLSDADAVIVGQVTAINLLPSPDEYDQPYVATIDVEQDLNDNLADVIYVRSHEDDGGNCGWNMTVGQEISAVLYENEGELRTDSCSSVRDEVLASYGPPINRPGSAEVIAGLWANTMRTIAYDADGIPFAFGFEPGVVQRISVCDDGASILELVQDIDSRNSRLAVRRLADFEVTSEIALDVDGDELFSFEMACSGTPDQPVVAVAGRLVTEGESVRDVWVHEGSAWERVEGAAEPKPGGIRHEAFWPELITTRGVAIPASYRHTVVVELSAPVEVSAQGVGPVRDDLGKGIPPDSVEPTPTPEPVDEAPPALEDPNRDPDPAEVAAEPEPVTEPSADADDPDGDDGPPRWIPFVSILGAAIIVGIVLSIARSRGATPPPDHGSQPPR